MPTLRIPSITRLALAAATLTAALTMAPACPVQAASCEGSFLLGLDGGAAAQAGLTVSGLSPTLPLALRASLDYARLDPGRPEEARHVFTNQANGGTPEKDGRMWTFGLDLLFPLARTTGARLDGYGGVRRGMFDAHFRYVGDNEEFDVTSNAWGLGGGLEGRAALGPGFSLVASGGIEYFAQAALHGHDATYVPDNDNVNARQEYVYADADRAVNQPKAQFRLMAGFTYRIGG
jgi:hypothetical protein